MPATEIELERPRLHPGQRAVADSPARFRVLSCGRRWGKTRLGTVLCLDVAAAGGAAWWVAPTYPMATVGWRGIRWLAAQIPGAEIREGERMVRLPSTGWIQVRSADTPDALRGEGLDFVVIDECAFVRPAAWSEALRPALADHAGRALFISTPHGRNWFWDLWRRGQDPAETDWQSWQFASADNPHLDPAEIDAARALLPERVFLQEFAAQFLDDGAGVFRHVRAAVRPDVPEPADVSGDLVGGIDWGKMDDFTVMTILDAQSGRQVALDRSNRVDYQTQLDRLRALHERWQPRLWLAERNAMGEPLIEQARRDGLPLQPFLTTAATKQLIIDGLALAFERGDLTLLNDPVQTAELEAFSAERLPSGQLRYGAPSGQHDDTVMALALAWHAAHDAPAPAIYRPDDSRVADAYAPAVPRWR